MSSRVSSRVSPRVSPAPNAWLGLLARLVLGAGWIWSGAAQLSDPTRSVAAVSAYRLLPGSTAETVGQLLPVVEIVVGLCLVVGVLRRGAGVISALLLAAFAVGVVSVWVRGIEIDVDLFGGGARAGTSSYAAAIARDLGLLLLCLYVATLSRTRLALENVLSARRAPAHPAPTVPTVPTVPTAPPSPGA